jgi:hypothetical protein
MKKLLILSLIIVVSCTNKNKVEIKLDKEIFLTGETITARIYIKHNNSILPVFHILTDYDTARIPVDSSDNQCGVYRARFKSTGTKKVSGFVIFTNEQNKIDTLNYQFEFKVEELPTIPGH